MRPSGDDRAWQGDPEAHRFRQGVPARGDLLDTREGNSSSNLARASYLTGWATGPCKLKRVCCDLPSARHPSSNRRVCPRVGDPDFTKSTRLVKGDAGGVFRKDTGLQGPELFRFGVVDKRQQKVFADTTASSFGRDVDRDFGDSSVYLSRGYGPERGPTEEAMSISRHESARLQMAAIPLLPVRQVNRREPSC